MPIYEHPISIRLTSKVASDSAGWGASSQTWRSDIHRAGFTAQPSANNSAAYVIPNTWIDPKAFADPTNANPEIGVTYVGEFSNGFFAPDGGGMFISGTGTVQNYPMDGKSGAKTFSILSQLNAFKTLGTTANGTTAFNFIIHGQNDAVFGQTGPSGGQVYFEYSGVTGNTDAGFSRDFYKQGSSYVLFNSNNNTTTPFGGNASISRTLSNASFRKDFDYNFIKLDPTNLAGIDIRGTTTGSLIYFDGLGSTDFKTFAGLSVGAICSFNALFPTVEFASASKLIGNPPLNISTLTQTNGLTFTYLGVTAGKFNNALLFRMDMSGSSGSLFTGSSGGVTIPISGKIAFGVPIAAYDSTGYAATPGRDVISLRATNAPNVGSRNLLSNSTLGLVASTTSPRLLIYPNEPMHMGFTGGSFIKITGAGNTGIYRVTNIYRGIAGDDRANQSIATSIDPFGASVLPQREYLELSGPIVPGSTPFVENVTDKPRLIIKYT